MPIVENVSYPLEPQIRNLWVYPKACPLSTAPDVVQRNLYFKHWAEYTPEHRPYPDDLLASMTSRPKVYRREGSAPSIYHVSQVPCPHNGIHGTILGYHYLTGGSTLFSNPLYDYAALKNARYWSAKLREKIADDKVNLGSSLAEYRETVKMFVKTAHGLHDAYKVLRGRMPRKKLRACSIPASVLQYNFGVAPLVSDLYDSAEVLRHRLDRPIYRRISAGITIKRQGEFPYGNYYHFGAKGVFSERATVHYQVDPSQCLSEDFDFGNPVEWAWELIPFSFVVDWAIPIGEWLGQLDALIGISNIHGTVTTRTEDSWKYRSNTTSYPVTERNGTYHASTYERGVIDTIPLPPIPKWSPSLGFKRAQNALSILIGMSSACRKR